MRKIKFYCVAALAFAILAMAPWGAAMAGDTSEIKDIDDGDKGKIYAVQKKLYSLKHEINLGAGFLPMDALYKGISYGGGYTYHLSHHWAWEAVQFIGSANIDTGLKKKLEEVPKVTPPVYQEVNFMAGSSAIFVPFYGKVTWLNRNVIQFEGSFVGGVGVANYTSFEIAGDGQRTNEKESYALSINLGTGLRVFINKHWSIRLDVRDYMNFVDGGLDNVVNIGLSAAWNFHLPKIGVYKDSE